ncbi:hypothetical protein GCM10028806_58820 [Spirosoma terrae]
MTNGQFLIGYTKSEISQYYSQHAPTSAVSYGQEQAGNFIKVLDSQSLVKYYLDSHSNCYMAKFFPKSASVTKRLFAILNANGEVIVDGYRWRLSDNEPSVDVFKMAESPTEFKIVSTQLATYVDNKIMTRSVPQQGKVDWEAVNRTPVYTNNGDYYSAYQIVDFAKQVKFTVHGLSIEQFEKVILKVGQAGIEQLNRDAAYKCYKEKDVMLRRYTEKYGPAPAATLERYCTLFTMLVIIGDNF